MQLSNLVQHLDAVTARGDLERDVRRVVLDPSEATADSLYVLLREAGPEAREGVPYLKPAAVLADVEVEVGDGVTLLVVHDARVALAQAAAAVSGRPGKQFPVVGITGTAGKTTVSVLLEVIASGAGRRIGAIDATGRRQPGTLVLGGLGRPAEAPQVQGWLRDMLDEGCNVGVIEASSRDLALNRLDETDLRVGVYTGLGREHLDFHGTPEAYLAAKLRLFRDVLRRDGTAIVAAHDAHASRFVEAAGRRTVWRYGRVRPGDDPKDLEIAASDIVLGSTGCSCHVRTPRGEGDLLLHAIGAHNLDNALAALGAALAAGIPLERGLDALASLTGLPRRLEPVQDPHETRTVLIDLASSPHALARAIEGARSLKPAKLYLVFGATPDQDPGQRPDLGQIASVGATRAWLTAGEPAGPDPEAIMDDVLQGVPPFATEDVVVEVDRRKAIQDAIEAAGPEDVVLITGLGDERSLLLGPSSKELAAEALDAFLPVLTSGLFEEL